MNEARVNWTTITVQDDGTDAREEIVPGSLDPAVDSGIPVFNPTSITSLGKFACYGNSSLLKSSGVWDFSDNLSMTRGKHTL